MSAGQTIPAQPQYTEQQADLLRRTLKEADARLGALRDELDGHARGRRYAKMATVAKTITEAAQGAQATEVLLDTVQTWLNARQHGR